MQTRREPKVHIYSKKKRRRKGSPLRGVLSVCFTFVVAGIIGTVGYSIAKPILEMNRTDDVQEESAAQTTMPETQTASYPPSALEQALSTTTVVTTPVVTEPVVREIQYAVRLPETALENADTLNAAIAAAKLNVPEMQMAVIPMKVQGGVILYDSEVALAKTCGAEQGTLTASDIVRIARENGCGAIASCSLLYDNLVPDGDPQAGYLTVDDGSRWLDNKKDAGGKPWISPFSESARQYLSDLITEMADAGFAEIWCSDLIFPRFRETDLNYLGDKVKDPARGDVLFQLLEQLAKNAGGVPLLPQVDAQGILDGTEEAFQNGLPDSGAVICADDSSQADAIYQQMPEISLWIADNGSLQIWGQKDDMAEQYEGQLYGFVRSELP